jgi:hypothetical protein
VALDVGQLLEHALRWRVDLDRELRHGVLPRSGRWDRLTLSTNESGVFRQTVEAC